MVSQFFQMQARFGSHLEMWHTRTTVMWPWRTLVKEMMPCSAWLTWMLVANLLVLVQMSYLRGTGSFPMELEFPAVVSCGISTEPEVTWWCSCIAEEVEWMGFTVVRYLIQWMLPRPYTLECTQQTLVSDIVCTLLLNLTTVSLYVADKILLTPKHTQIFWQL